MDVPYSVIEWTIENFSCWNYRIHSNKFSLLKRQVIVADDDEIFLELFPRGFSCREKHLNVRFFNPWFSGVLEVSVIGSNGSIIVIQSINVKEYEVENFIGPEYDQCIGYIRKDEPYHKDSLTLRFEKKCGNYNRLHVRFAIGVFNASIKINSRVFEERNFRKDAWNIICKIEYLSKHGIKDQVELHAYRIDCASKTNVKLKLVPVFVRSTKTLAVMTSFYQSGKYPAVKFQDIERVFTERCEQIAMQSLPIAKVPEWDFYVILRLKIVREDLITSYHMSFYPCEIEMDPMNSNSSQILSTAASSPHSSVNKLQLQLTILCLNRDFCDFQIRCGQFTFPVHKGILSARSPVFEGMLSSNMREAVSGSMDVVDLDPSTLNRFLFFLYTGIMLGYPRLQWDSVLKLYYAADKYQVPSLKRECVKILCDEISVSNVCEVMLLADNHMDPKLTSVAEDFLLKNYDQIVKTQKWGNFIAAHPRFHIKTLELLSQKRMPLLLSS